MTESDIVFDRIHHVRRGWMYGRLQDKEYYSMDKENRKGFQYVRGHDLIH